MLSEVLVYLRLGFNHLLDINAFDHILFVGALCAGFVWKEWKKLLILITSFTVGHTTTLALATLYIVNISTSLVELIIPITIFATCVTNVLTRNKRSRVGEKETGGSFLLYSLTLFFGLIHGLGFSTFLRALLGAEESIVIPLLAFNIGLEIAQIALVVSCLVVIGTVLKTELLNRKQLVVVISTLIGISSLFMMAARLKGL